MPTFSDGGNDTFNAIALGEPHPNTQHFLNYQATALGRTDMLTQAGRAFHEQSQQLYDRLAESRSMQFVKAAQRAAGHIWQENMIHPLNTIGDMQWAPPVMRPYVMAEPTVRRMYHQNEIEGYSDVYTDPEPGCVDEDHYYYRRATNGLVMFNEGEDTPEWSATTWYDDLYEDDRELELVEQADIIETWQNMRARLNYGQPDPTSRWNADI